MEDKKSRVGESGRRKTKRIGGTSRSDGWPRRKASEERVVDFCEFCCEVYL